MACDDAVEAASSVVIIALSRFRVASGYEAEVRAAFVNRPRRVELANGFRGLEVYVDDKTPTAFLLVTRWTDAAAFHAWHESPEHHASHALMPEGLELDPKGTELIIASKLEHVSAGGHEAELVLEHVVELAAIVREGRALSLVELGSDATVLVANHAFDAAMGLPALGRSFEELVAPEAVAAARDARRKVAGTPVLIQFVNDRAEPFTLRCRFFPRDRGALMLGEPPWDHHVALEQELTRINVELSVLLRENARQTRALAEAHAQLKHAHWHLEKVTEVLPMCMVCKRVRTGSAEDAWEEVAGYLQRASTFLSHGYCARCARLAEDDARRDEEDSR